MQEHNRPEIYALSYSACDLLVGAVAWPTIRTLRLCRNRHARQYHKRDSLDDQEQDYSTLQAIGGDLSRLPEEAWEHIEACVVNIIFETKIAYSSLFQPQACYCHWGKTSWTPYAIDCCLDLIHSVFRVRELDGIRWMDFLYSPDVAISRIRRWLEQNHAMVLHVFQTERAETLAREGCADCNQERWRFWRHITHREACEDSFALKASGLIYDLLNDHNLIALEPKVPGDPYRNQDPSWLEAFIGVPIPAVSASPPPNSSIIRKAPQRCILVDMDLAQIDRPGAHFRALCRVQRRLSPLMGNCLGVLTAVDVAVAFGPVRERLDKLLPHLHKLRQAQQEIRFNSPAKSLVALDASVILTNLAYMDVDRSSIQT